MLTEPPRGRSRFWITREYQNIGWSSAQLWVIRRSIPPPLSKFITTSRVWNVKPSIADIMNYSQFHFPGRLTKRSAFPDHTDGAALQAANFQPKSFLELERNFSLSLSFFNGWFLFHKCSGDGDKWLVLCWFVCDAPTAVKKPLGPEEQWTQTESLASTEKLINGPQDKVLDLRFFFFFCLKLHSSAWELE